LSLTIDTILAFRGRRPLIGVAAGAGATAGFFLCIVNGGPLCLLSRNSFFGSMAPSSSLLFHPSLASRLDVGHGWDFRSLFVGAFCL
jgi:hypothetical protein